MFVFMMSYNLKNLSLNKNLFTVFRFGFTKTSSYNEMLINL